MTISESTGTRIGQRLGGPVELVVLDIAGTTVRDDGVVERSFEAAAQRTGVVASRTWPEALDYVRRTMGQSKIDVFTELADGDVPKAAEATAAFEDAYAEIIAEDGVDEVPGARALIEQLKAEGVAVVLTTGFAPVTRDAILARLGWDGLVDAALSPVDAGRGRPAPDLVLAAALRTGVTAMDRVVVAGDTASDMASGRRAGAGLVVGVLTGSHDADALTEGGADAVLGSIAELRALLTESVPR